MLTSLFAAEEYCYAIELNFLFKGTVFWSYDIYSKKHLLNLSAVRSRFSFYEPI